MELLIRSIGAPTEETWPGVTSLPLYTSLVSATQSSLTSLQSYSFVSPTLRVACSSSHPLSDLPQSTFEKRIADPALSFLEGLLIPDPNKRLSARAALANRSGGHHLPLSALSLSLIAISLQLFPSVP
jgi:hypothetical protein